MTYSQLACGLLLLLLGSSGAQAMPELIVLVRHAERASTPANDPSLSVAGQQRAQRLVQQLADARISHILTTPYRRTAETAAPVAAAFGITPTVIDTGGSLAAHVETMTAALKATTGVVLVVGHSNTVPALVAALSGRQILPLCEQSYSHLFVLRLLDEGAAVLHGHYGVADPAPVSDCQ
jgi:phosphohistidine phosphatase SixA